MQRLEVGQAVGQVGQAVRKRRDIEQVLRWAYGEECVAAPGAAGGAAEFLWLAGGRSNAEATMDMLALGTVVDGGGPRASSPDRRHRDALVVHELVSELPRDVRSMVVLHALRGTRPEAFVGINPRCVPVLTPGGRVQMEYRRRGQRDPYLCLITYSPSPVEVAAARGAYERWHIALEWLADSLRGRLERFAVLPPGAARRPWEEKEA